MNQQRMFAEVAELQRRVAALRLDANHAREPSTLLERALSELQTSVEELRVMEEELRNQNESLVDANATLELERRRWAELFQRAPVAYLVTDKHSTILDVNLAAGALLHQPAAGLKHKPLALLVAADDRPRWRDLVARVDAGAQPPCHGTVRIHSGDGWVRVRISGSRGASGAQSLLLWILEDLDAVERAAAAAQTVEHGRHRDEFLAMLGHELRNPLAPIRAAVELWRSRDIVLSEEQRARTVEVVGRQADHLAHLVDDLLDVSRVAHGKVRLRKAVVDLREVIEQSHDVVRAQAQLHQLTLELPDAPVRVYGDAVRLRQVFVNLLDNALKFTPRGRKITVRLDIDGALAVVDVADEGVGIAPDQLPNVFGAFVQTEESLARTSSGLGLGLSLVQRLVEQHGGTVGVRSDGLGRGTTFSVSLPRTQKRPTGETARPDALAGLSKLHLLVVDDNVDGAQMLGRLLETHGHTATLAFDGAGAIEAFGATPPDAVLLDLGLPDIDGLEVARHMRLLRPGAHLIAVTGYGDERVRNRVRGFSDHLLKPVELEALRRALDKVTPRRSG